MISKLFGWTRYRISPQDREESLAALKQAEAIAQVAQAIRQESERVGARQPHLRQENGFGNKLTHVFRNA